MYTLQYWTLSECCGDGSGEGHTQTHHTSHVQPAGQLLSLLTAVEPVCSVFSASSLPPLTLDRAGMSCLNDDDLAWLASG